VWVIRQRRWLWGGLVVWACLVGLSYYLDTILREYVESSMNQRITGYSVRIRAVRFHPIGFALDLVDMTVTQDQHPAPPVLHIPRLRASVDWGALLDRRLVADFLVERPKAYVNLTQARAEIQDKTAMRERGWQEALESIYPLKINVFRLEEGEVTYVDRGPFRPLQLSQVQLHADNIRNVRSPDHVYPSPIHLEAVVFDTGKVVLDGNANFLAEPHPGLRASLSLEGVVLDYFKPITERYNVAIRGGVLSSSGDVEYAPMAKTVHLQAVSIRGADIEYVHKPETAVAETQTVQQIRAAARQVTNHSNVLLRVDDVTILHSTFTFRNQVANTPYWVSLADAQIRLANVSNQRAEGKLRGDMTGKFMDSGDAAVHLTLSPDVKRPEFDVTVRVDATEVPAMNDVLRAYAGVDAVGGRFSLYSEVSVRQGTINGYVKPLFKDLDLYDARQDRHKPFFHKLKEGLMAAAAWTLKNRDRGEVATKINLSGPLDSPRFSTWEALGGFLENAFVRAILPGFEGKDRSRSG
jgi:hypothetical protein